MKKIVAIFFAALATIAIFANLNSPAFAGGRFYGPAALTPTSIATTDTTDSTTTATGAIVTPGGVGIAKKITVGGIVTSTATTESTTTATGAIVTAGGIGAAKNLTVGGTATVTGTISGAGGSTNHAVCWKAAGVLGYCSVVVDASGVCGTCN